MKCDFHSLLYSPFLLAIHSFILSTSLSIRNCSKALGCIKCDFHSLLYSLYFSWLFLYSIIICFYTLIFIFIHQKLFFLQAKEEILQDNVYCPTDKAVLLASLAVGLYAGHLAYVNFVVVGLMDYVRIIFTSS
jgi:hypothetical protein